MPFNGSGTFSRNYSWQNDAANSIPIKADRMDADANDLAAGLSNCITRDGQGKPSTAMDWNNQDLQNVKALGASSISVSGTASLPGLTGIGSSRVQGLLGAVNSTAPTVKFDLSADAVVLRNSAGALVTRYSTGTITCDLSAAGSIANGRDQSTAFTANSWINLFFIWNGTTLATIASTAAATTGPTLPSGYTHWCYATTIRWNASSNIIQCIVRGARVIYDTDLNVTRALNGGTATAFTAVSLASFAPPNTLRAQVNMYLSLANSTITTIVAIVRPTGSAKQGLRVATATVAVAGGGSDATNTIEIGLGTSQQLDYQLTAAPTSGGLYFDVVGYAIPNGDA